jgi:hypothetical protein
MYSRFDSGSTLLAALGDLLKQAFPEIHALDRIVVEEYRTNREGVAIAPYMNGVETAPVSLALYTTYIAQGKKMIKQTFNDSCAVHGCTVHSVVPSGSML